MLSCRHLAHTRTCSLLQVPIMICIRLSSKVTLYTTGLQVNELQQQLAKSHAACSDMLSLGSLLDRERIDKARLQANLSTARIERSVPRCI
jgi:hypothetical protein